MTDAARFEAFVREYQDMVFATALRLLGNRVEAEDVSQNVFLKAFQHFREIGGSPQAAGWLKTVTRNFCLNHMARYRARWQFFSELEADPGGGRPRGPHPSTFASPAPDPALADRAAHVERALGRLPDHQRVPLVLFHFEDLSYDEIAKELGISLSKVKTDIHRGREVLKRELAAFHGSN